ncbi:allantoicase [soil metagenome]
MTENTGAAAFAGLTELAAEKIGGKALFASDEFFAEKENLLKPGRGIFLPDEFTENGKWMDGWESRRKRTEGHDWCIIKLGITGVVKGLDIDTNHFLGNHPPYASVDGYQHKEKDKVIDFDKIKWTELLPKSPLAPGSQNLFPVSNPDFWTHLRLNIYPDGGVARFRVYGDVHKGNIKAEPDGTIDLAALVNGGKVLAANDMFFGSKDNLISPGKSEYMGDGWETRRKRIPGYDWTILKLGERGKIKNIIVDTNHFKGNYPDSCMIEGTYIEIIDDDKLTSPDIKWTEILPKSKLKGHHENVFENEITGKEKYSHIRLNIYPDGGVSRLRVIGTPENLIINKKS